MGQITGLTAVTYYVDSAKRSNGPAAAGTGDVHAVGHGASRGIDHVHALALLCALPERVRLKVVLTVRLESSTTMYSACALSELEGRTIGFGQTFGEVAVADAAAHLCVPSVSSCLIRGHRIFGA